MNEEAQTAEESQPRLSTPERFNELYPGGKMRELTYEEVPPFVMERFESWSSKYISPEQYVPKNFIGLYELSHENGDSTYIAELLKQYGENPSTGILQNFVESYFLEMRGEVEIGHSEIRRDTSEQPVHGGRPYVSWTSTEDEFQRNRHGERRANTMNAFTQAQYDTPLSSGTLLSDAVHGMYSKMAESGEVKRVVDESTKPPTVSYRMSKIIPKEEKK